MKAPEDKKVPASFSCMRKEWEEFKANCEEMDVLATHILEDYVKDFNEIRRRIKRK